MKLCDRPVIAAAKSRTASRFIDFKSAGLIILLILYLLVSLRHLEVVPPVYEDEPWIASAGWKLATEGVFGSDMFTGFSGMERHNFFFMPVHPLILAVVFKIAGLGLFQARLVPVMMGLCTLLLTYWLGQRLFGARVALLAIFLMLVVRQTGVTRYQMTGIIFLDLARISRYDFLVPVFGLLSLHTYISARHRDARFQYALSGIFAALAGLSNVYGAFWLLALGLLALWDQVSWKRALLIVPGFGIAVLPYLAYIFTNFADWSIQTRFFTPRFDLLNLNFYWQNLLREPSRYGPGLGQPGLGYLLRPGFWSISIAVPAGLIFLAARAYQHNDRAARTIVVPALLFPALFGLLIASKVVSYTLIMLPLGYLAAAWGGLVLWDWADSLPQKRWLRVILGFLLLLVSLEGVSRVALIESSAQEITPYRSFITRVRQHIPPGSTVLGLHNYWFGLEDYNYRNWAVPFFKTDPRYYTPPLSLPEAMGVLSPDVILIDPNMRAYFDSPARDDPIPAAVLSWMASTGYVRTALVEDSTYGPMEIYSLAP